MCCHRMLREVGGCAEWAVLTGPSHTTDEIVLELSADGNTVMRHDLVMHMVMMQAGCAGGMRRQSDGAH